jgi:hypothetical protein
MLLLPLFLHNPHFQGFSMLTKSKCNLALITLFVLSANSGMANFSLEKTPLWDLHKTLNQIDQQTIEQLPGLNDLRSRFARKYELNVISHAALLNTLTRNAELPESLTTPKQKEALQNRTALREKAIQEAVSQVKCSWHLSLVSIFFTGRHGINLVPSTK